MTVTLHFNSERLEAPPGSSLFDCADQLGIRVPTSCLKNGKCRECLVEVVAGMECISPPSPQEAHLRENFRLSCRARIVAERGVIRCHTLRRTAMRIEERAEGLPPSSAVRQPDPAVTRAGDRILLDGEEIARASGPLFGLAVDLGTTTVVMRLVDLESGGTIATRSFENPQRFAGTDVMARIKYDGDHRGRLLQRTLIAYVNHAIESLGCDPGAIYELTVAGNSTMRDLFFGLNVQSIGQRPYRSLTEHDLLQGRRSTTSLSTKAGRLRLAVHPEARVYGLPLIGSHVGADAAACLLAADLMNEDRIVALMDIGTNTELIVGNRTRLMAASCPAGPAFEGGSLVSGMPGLEGAVEGVTLGDDGTFRLRVIGDRPPEGICGSGLVQLLGELLRAGRMNSSGRFEDGEDRVVLDAKRNVVLVENDVSLLAQAKGANVAGLYVVLREYGIDFDDLEVLYLAGGFARHLDVTSAKRIGLIPDLPDGRIVQIGNASVEGAAIALLSAGRRRELEAFVRGIPHVELETDPQFFDYFVDGTQFIPVTTTLRQR